MLMMVLSSLLLIALIAVLIWAVVSWLNEKNANTTTPSAMEVLRRRYARGEIDTATFEQMRERLEAHEQESFVQSRRPLGGVH